MRWLEYSEQMHRARRRFLLGKRLSGRGRADGGQRCPKRGRCLSMKLWDNLKQRRWKKDRISKPALRTQLEDSSSACSRLVVNGEGRTLMLWMNWLLVPYLQNYLCTLTRILFVQDWHIKTHSPSRRVNPLFCGKVEQRIISLQQSLSPCALKLVSGAYC